MEASHTPASRQEMLRLFPTGGVVAEVGVQRGAFSLQIYATLKPRVFYLIDCWEKQDGDYVSDPANNQRHGMNYQAVQRRFSRLPGCQIMKMYSVDAAKRIADSSLDFLYIDANHTHDAVLQDLNAWWPKIRVGGAMAGHDYIRDEKPWVQVVQAFETWGRTPDIITSTGPRPDHVPSWVLWKK